jgi:hypothetical protein
VDEDEKDNERRRKGVNWKREKHMTLLQEQPVGLSGDDGDAGL